MKRVVSTILVAAISIGVAGCVDDGYRSNGHGRASIGISYQDGYYDNFYGSFHDGYWGGDGSYYFRDAPDHPYRQDREQHFRREGANGYHQFQSRRSEDGQNGEQRHNRNSDEQTRDHDHGDEHHDQDGDRHHGEHDQDRN